MWLTQRLATFYASDSDERVTRRFDFDLEKRHARAAARAARFERRRERRTAPPSMQRAMTGARYMAAIGSYALIRTGASTGRSRCPSASRPCAPSLARTWTCFTSPRPRRLGRLGSPARTESGGLFCLPARRTRFASARILRSMAGGIRMHRNDAEHNEVVGKAGRLGN